MKLPEQNPLSKYVWEVGQNTPNWIGDGNQLLWNEPTWQSGDIHKVFESTEKFMNQNESKLADRDRFWIAFLQLTPALGASITTFLKDGGSVSPKDLALGGGMGTHGSFTGSNKTLRDSGVLKEPLWKKNASCLLYDFADEKTSGAIVAMNVGAGNPPQGAGESAHEEHEGGGRGGRGGGHGGRGGHEGPHRGGRGGRGRGD